AETGAIDAAAPELIWAEVTHALLRYVRGGFMSVEAAQERLVWLLGVPIVLESPAAFAPAALSRAVDYGLSTYDAFYLVLAEAADATLITADRRLAERAPRAELGGLVAL